MNSDTVNRAIVTVEALYSPGSGAGSQVLACPVVCEDALTLDIEGVGLYTLMWTPTGAVDIPLGYTLDDGVLGDTDQPEGLALALGFSLSEGIIGSLQDLRSVAVCDDNPGVIRIQLQQPEQVKTQRRNVVIDSSCGLCGPREIIEDNALDLNRVTDSLSLERAQLPHIMDAMRQDQGIFDQTGGSHAAAIFDSAGQVVAVAEDLGRHNALDKAIGLALLQHGTITGFGVALSSRLSLEMVVKAIRSDLEIVLAVSAPTSLAVEVAQHFGVTLCGFVREDRATIYTHPARIT
jgi:FdhD protein